MPMATNGVEGLGSMGTDTPLACLSDKPQLLYNYFRQLFAQVTNPPLDANFEELVTSLYTYLGREGNLLDESAQACHLIKLKQPILSNTDLAKLREVSVGDLRSVTIPMLFPSAEARRAWKRPSTTCATTAAEAVKEGASILILSDRGVDPELAPIPSLLATAAVHHHLIRLGIRTQCGLVIETGEAREIHHFCLLIGYGAGAVNPYVAFETLADLQREGMLPKDMSLDQAKKNYIKASNKGIIKVASKMGISTVQSYRGAQIFEAVGLSHGAGRNATFTGTASRMNGIGLDIIAQESLARHHHGFPPISRQWRSAGERRLLSVAPRRRIPHVESRHGGQAPAGRAHHRHANVQGIHQAGQ